MNLHVRSQAAAVALGIVAVAYLAYPARTERPGPPRPAPSPSASRAAALPPAPPTAAEILDRQGSLGLRGDQVIRLEALDRLWAREVGGLVARIHETEKEFSVFVREAQETAKVSLSEIQRRSAEFRQLSGELR